jgi:hypothetical protein
MKRLTIGIVAEGPTDGMLIELLINRLLQTEPHYVELQPKQSKTGGFGVYGGGWRGVRAWCQSLAFDSQKFKAHFLQLDLLIIHVDADIAREDEINCAKPCPPVQDSCEALAQRVMTWLGEPVIDDKLVLCIPADNTEAWVLAAHDIQTAYHAPPDKPLECVNKPDMIISNQRYKKPRRLLRRKDGKPKKTRRDYQQLIPVVLDNWEEVKRICKQAEKFENDLKASVEYLRSPT